jgi:hypothetical protein
MRLVEVADQAVNDFGKPAAKINGIPEAQLYWLGRHGARCENGSRSHEQAGKYAWHFH